MTALCAFACACNRLPEPESPGAHLYLERCATCHRAYQPQTMKFEMWKVVLGRMQGVMTRNGLRPLSDDEMTVLLDYLRRNAG
jgi:hypothetical protein